MDIYILSGLIILAGALVVAVSLLREWLSFAKLKAGTVERLTGKRF